MKYSFELQTEIPIEKIWPLYNDVNNWFKWEDNLENISLDGTFTQGTNGTMKLSGQPAMDFLLVSVVQGTSFTDKSPIPNIGDIYFSHELSIKNNQTLIKHSVEFVPYNRKPTLKDTEFISQVFSDVPASIFSLIEAANG